MLCAFTLIGLLLITLLLAFSAEALAAAADGLTLWWTAVLPALFPFYIGTELMYHASRPAGQKLNPFASLVGTFLMGAVSGYPLGARLAVQNGQTDYAPYVNLCSPVFIIGVLGTGMLGDARLAVPILIAHIASAALMLVTDIAFFGLLKASAYAPPDEQARFSLIGAVSDGMNAMLRIGGCIVLFLVLSALLKKIGVFALIAAPFSFLGVPQEAVYAVLTGLIEFTGGCRAVVLCGLTARMTCSLLASLTSFGGLCVLLQSALFVRLDRPLRYLLIKTEQALLAFFIAYCIQPLFSVSDVPAMYIDPKAAIENAAAGGTLLAVSASAMAFIALLSVLLSRIRPRSARP